MHWRVPPSAASASQVRRPTQAELLEIVRLNRAFTVKGYYDSPASQKRCLALIDLQLRSLPPEHPEVVSNRRLLADSFRSSHQYEKAAEQYRALLKVYQRVIGADDPVTLSCQKDLNNVLRELAWTEEGMRSWQTNYKEKSQELGMEHPEVLKIQSMIAGNLMVLSKFREAEKELRFLVNALRKTPQEGANSLTESLIDLASCLNEQGKRIEASEIAHEVEWILADTPRMDQRCADSVTSLLKAIDAGRIRHRAKA